MKKRFYQLGKKAAILSAIAICTMLSANQTFAQGVSINATGTGVAPHVSAILDLSDVANKGFLAPRVALTGTTDLMGNPTIKEGLLVYHTGGGIGAAGFYYNASTVPATPNWTPISSSSGTITGTGTTNIHAKWTGTNSLGDGLFYDNGTTVSISTASTNSAAILDLNVTNKGVLVPNVALASTNDVAAVAGAEVASLLIYNTATAGTSPNDVKPGFYYWSSTLSVWIPIASNLPTPSAGNGGYLVWDATAQIYRISPMTTDGITSTLNDNLSINGDALATGKVVQSSDIRFKKNVKSIDNALENVLKLRGVTYEWKRDEFPERNFSKGTTYGVIAQEVEKIIPELVNTSETDGYKSVAYSNMSSLFIEAIKEQQAIIDAQINEISALRVSLETEKNTRNEQLNALLTRLTSLENNVEHNINKAEK
jgi:hypothetical protein